VGFGALIFVSDMFMAYKLLEISKFVVRYLFQQASINNTQHKIEKLVTVNKDTSTKTTLLENM